MGFDIVGLDADGLIVVCNGFREMRHLFERDATVVKGLVVIRLQPDCLVVTRYGFHQFPDTK